MRKFLIGLGVLIVLAIGGCSVLLPEKFSVNAPIMNSLFGWGADAAPEDELNQRLTLADGYQLNIYAQNLGHARIMRWTQAGDILLTTPRSGEVKLIERDANGDRRGDGVRTLVSELNRPHGLAFHDGWLYIGETDAVARIRFDHQTGAVSGKLERVITGLPGGGNHWTRTLQKGPDGKIYVNVGSSCNVCIEEDARRATLMRFNPDGSGLEIFAEGLRNTVGFDWQPGTGDLYGVDNGRDLLGDDLPPGELNLIEQGKFYGWPFLNGDNVPDPDFGATPDPRVAAALPPAHNFPAHVAALSIHFLGDHAPPGLENAALVAFHGSWNRSEKQGYEIVSLHWHAGIDRKPVIERRPFLSGFEIDEDVIGRPVDVTQGPDGAIYVTDDYAGAIYRVSYGADQTAGAQTTKARQEQQTAAGTAAQDPGQDPEAVSRGAALWASYNCALCHDASAAPAGMAVKTLEKLDTRFDAQALADLLAVPPANMPAYDLSDSKKADLAAYLLATYN